MSENARGAKWRKVQGNALGFYQQLVAQTARWHFEGKANITLARAHGRPILWTCWHAQLMNFITYGARFEGGEKFVLVLVGDPRGDVLAAMKEGGTGKHAFGVIKVIRAMKSGKDSFLAPDGPDGPAFIAKRGVAFLAQKANAVVLPVGLQTRHAHEMNRWDRYIIPFPFAKMHVVIGKPILAEPGIEEDSLLEEISDSLHETRTRAQVLSGIEPWR